MFTDKHPLVLHPVRRRAFARVLIAGAGLALLAPMIALAGDNGPPPGNGSAPWGGQTYRHMVDPRTGISFDVPDLGFRLETRHFDPKTPPSRIKHAFMVSGPEGFEVSIDVFENPDHLSLQQFFDTYLDFMRDSQAAVTDGTAGVRHVPALLIEQPRVPGSFPQPSAVFALGDRIIRVTCIDEDNDRAAKVYVHILETLDSPVARAGDVREPGTPSTQEAAP